MKHKSILIISSLIIALLQSCNPTKEKEVNACENAKNISGQLINDFYIDNDSTYLDSAVHVIDKAICNCNDLDKKFLTLRKISIFSILKNYKEAIIYIETIDIEFFKNFPYSREFLSNRFKAMKYQNEEDTTNRNIYLQKCLSETNEFINNKQMQVDSLMTLPDFNDILSDPLTIRITQHYYYRSLLEGYEEIDKELLLLKSETKLNEDFYEYLNYNLQQDFLTFVGV
jgi:hypothetical protein